MGAEEAIPLSELFLEWFLFRFRWIFVILFVIPASLLYDGYFLLRNYLIFKLNSAPKAHNRKVAVIQKQIREWNDGGRKKKLCTARAGFLTMSFRYPKYKKDMLGIKTDQLVDILEIDTQNRTVRVEPMVTMGQLSRYLVPLGFTLPVLPELDDLTVGGMINGCGVESSGRKYGMFQHICLEFEVVTADGELVVARKDGADHQSLFYGIPWSHGTLGFVVAATIKIIPCKPFVKLAYTPVHGVKDLIPFGNHALFRYALGWAVPPKVSLLKLTTPGPLRRLYNRHHMIQDMLVPLSALPDSVRLIDDQVGVYPIWLCPFHLPSMPGLLRNRTGSNVLFVDVGVYGNATRPGYRARETTRKLEQFVRDVKGAQMLYADTYMTPSEFWEMFDSSLYDWLRVTYNCQDAFPNVYQKTCREARE